MGGAEDVCTENPWAVVYKKGEDQQPAIMMKQVPSVEHGENMKQILKEEKRSVSL